jgi:hypothetical protein
MIDSKESQYATLKVKNIGIDPPGGRIREYIQSVREKKGLSPRSAFSDSSPAQKGDDMSVPEGAQRNGVEANKSNETDSSTYKYNSDNLATAVEANQIPKLENGRLRGVFLLGSTNSRWREEGVEQILNGENIVTYNPNMSDWNPEVHPKAEALGLNEFGVLGLRVENAPGVTDGSLGSLVEIGMAIYSAMLNGQKVVISFDETFEGSLVEAGAKAQYQALKEQLNSLAMHLPELVKVQLRSSREEFAKEVKNAMAEQDEKPRALISAKELQAFQSVRNERLRDTERFIVMGGTSAATHESLDDSFHATQETIESVFGSDRELTSLNKGTFAGVWENIQKRKEDAEARGIKFDVHREMMLYRQAFAIESGLKAKSDVLVWSVQKENDSKAAITEIGFFLINALQEGQQLCILLENFDVDLFTKALFKKEGDRSKLTAALANKAVALEGQTGEQADTERQQMHAALEVLQSWEANPDSVTFAQLKKTPILNKSEFFQRVDNARRTRAIIQEQLKKTQERAKQIMGAEGVELFIASNDLTDFVQKMALISTPAQFEGREAFYDSYRQFSDKLEGLVAAHPGERDKASELIDEAVSVVNPPEQRFAGLTQHLGEVKDYAGAFNQYLRKLQESRGREYLSNNQLDLIEQVIAPNHDKLKFLGGSDVQVMPDHEILIGHVLRHQLPGLGFNPEEVSFMAEVVGDHENIFKEKNRNFYSRSERPDERAKAYFFVLDTLTGAIGQGENGELVLNEALLEKRFTDLYFRHIDLEKGKVFRPEWGSFALQDFSAFFTTLQKEYGAELEPDFFKKLNSAAMKAVDQAITANDQRVAAGSTNVFDESQKQRIATARMELSEMRSSLETTV